MIQNINKKDTTLNKSSEHIEITSFGARDKKLSQDGTSRDIYNIPNSCTKGSKIKMISGIDTLHYFVDFDTKYNLLYSQLIIDYDNNVKNGNPFVFILGKKFKFIRRDKGYYFFREENEFYDIGFKSLRVNRGLEPICVELLYKSIYSIGIEKILETIDETFKGYIGSFKSITRVDINVFVQYDFSNIRENSFATAKSQVRPFYNKGKLETIYIGKRPHLLRLYNKLKELRDKKGDKEPLLIEYFKKNGLNINEHIWNLEFQINRAFLKARSIRTVADTLKNINNLFRYSMEHIRLTDSVVEASMRNKSRISTSYVWDSIKNGFNYNNSQTKIPLDSVAECKTILNHKKIKLKVYQLIDKAYTQNIHITINFFADVLSEYLKDKNIPTPMELGLKNYEYIEETNTVLINLSEEEKDAYVRKQFNTLIDFMKSNRYEIKLSTLELLLKEYKDEYNM